MTPVQCCMKCERVVKGPSFTCGFDDVLVGVHHKAAYCPLACFGTDRTPGEWDKVGRGEAAPQMVPEPEIPVEMLTDEERRGLGDVIKDGIHAVGLDVLWNHWLFNRFRGLPDDHQCSQCEFRRRWLNRLANWKK